MLKDSEVRKSQEFAAEIVGTGHDPQDSQRDSSVNLIPSTVKAKKKKKKKAKKVGAEGSQLLEDSKLVDE